MPRYCDPKDKHMSLDKAQRGRGRQPQSAEENEQKENHRRRGRGRKPNKPERAVIAVEPRQEERKPRQSKAERRADLHAVRAAAPEPVRNERRAEAEPAAKPARRRNHKPGHRTENARRPEPERRAENVRRPEPERRAESSHRPEPERRAEAVRRPEFDHARRPEPERRSEFDHGHRPESRAVRDRRPEFDRGRRPVDEHEREEDSYNLRPHGQPTVPDGALLRQRVADAGLGELLRLSGRLMPRDHGGPARGQALILSILAGREALSQRALQQMLGVQPGSMSEIVTKLERKGYLSREKGGDRRGNMLRITEAGRQAIPQDGDGDEAYFVTLTSRQRQQLANTLRQLLNDWIDKMP